MLDLLMHRYKSKDGRHWSSDVLRRMMDGEDVSLQEQADSWANRRWVRKNQ